MLVVGQQEGHMVSKKAEWWDVGEVIWLELHMVQLMPLPLCVSKIDISFTLLILAHLGSPRLSNFQQFLNCSVQG